MPVAPLAIIALPSARQLGEKISSYISDFRRIDSNSEEEIPYRDNYYQDSYLMDVNLERFQTGEGRAVMLESARGKDVFILVDVMNWTVTYKMNGFVNHMSPDDHFQDLKRGSRSSCPSSMRDASTTALHENRSMQHSCSKSSSKWE